MSRIPEIVRYIVESRDEEKAIPDRQCRLFNLCALARVIERETDRILEGKKTAREPEAWARAQLARTKEDLLPPAKVREFILDLFGSTKHTMLTMLLATRDLRHYLRKCRIHMSDEEQAALVWKQVWVSAAHIDKHVQRVYHAGVRVQRDAAPMVEVPDSENWVLDWPESSLWEIVPVPRVVDLLEEFSRENRQRVAAARKVPDDAVFGE